MDNNDTVIEMEQDVSSEDDAEYEILDINDTDTRPLEYILTFCNFMAIAYLASSMAFTPSS